MYEDARPLLPCTQKDPAGPRFAGSLALVWRLDAMIDGGEAKIAFNARYLSDVLAVIRQKQVALETTTPSSPGVLRPVGIDNYVHVVMPMFVQW